MLVETKREQVFQISPSVRVVADYEEDYETLQQVCENVGLGIQTLRSPNHYRQYSTSDEYSDDIQAIIGMAMYNYAFEDIQAKVSEFLTNQGIPFLVCNLKGFSQGEWYEVVIYDAKKEWDIKGLKSVAEELDARFAGEVYRVSVEYAKVFVADDGDTRTEWVTDDDLGYREVVEKLFTLNADYIYNEFSLEVMTE